jgi:hypothetical protein
MELGLYRFFTRSSDDIIQYGATVNLYLQDKIEGLGEKPVPLSLSPTQISREVN